MDETGKELEGLKALAEKWRERLEDRRVKEQVKAGTVRVNPLVKRLLTAFPPAKK